MLSAWRMRARRLSAWKPSAGRLSAWRPSVRTPGFGRLSAWRSMYYCKCFPNSIFQKINVINVNLHVEIAHIPSSARISRMTRGEYLATLWSSTGTQHHLT